MSDPVDNDLRRLEAQIAELAEKFVRLAIGVEHIGRRVERIETLLERVAIAAGVSVHG